MGFWSWVSGYDESNAAAGEAADLKIREMLFARFGPSSPNFKPAKWRAVLVDYARQDGKPDDYYISAWGQQRFVSGVDSAIQAERQAAEIERAAGAGAGMPWRFFADVWRVLLGALPAWFWVGVLVLLFWWLGGFGWIRRKIALV